LFVLIFAVVWTSSLLGRWRRGWVSTCLQVHLLKQDTGDG